MARFARWHIWLAWLAGIPLLMWTITGLVMVARPIEEVRGEHLRIEQSEQALTSGFAGLGADQEVREMRAYMQRGVPVMVLTRMDGSVERIDLESGKILPPLDALAASAAVAEAIEGGDKVSSVTLFEADQPAFDFRRPMAAWQVALEDGTHVYVGRDTGEIEAVRTRWWRLFDLMWGFHIMDLQDREDTSHPVLILFAALAVIGSLLGVVLMFRRRKGFLRR